MAYYPRITNIVQNPKHWEGNLGQCGFASYDYVAPVPVQDTVQVPENLLIESKFPPHDSTPFGQVKKSGVIRMTNYRVSKTQGRYFKVGVPEYSWALGWPNCSDGVRGPAISASASWVRWYGPNDPLPDRSVTTNPDIPDIEHERNSLMSNVVKANLSTYDVLTDLMEAKETAEMILSAVKAVRNPLKAFLDLKKSLENRKGLDPKKVKKQIEDAWMQVRYGVMPLYYSINDIIKTLKEKDDIYKTDRASKTFTYTIGGKPASQEGVYVYTREDVSLRINVVGKARYDPAELKLRLFDQLGINPFVTAWELVPLSFVADWFANIGDWVLAQTANVTDGAQERAFCHTLKEIRVRTTYIVANQEWKARREYPWGVVTGGPIQVNIEDVLSEVKTETYSRSLFVPSDVKLQSDVYLNWKRMIDAWVLGNRPVIDGLRRLR